jgi:hypothetical protein
LDLETQKERILKITHFRTYALYQLQEGHEDSDYTIGWIIQVFLLDIPSSSGAHSASYSMGTGGSFLRETAAGA